jgi:hypothetical protein
VIIVSVDPKKLPLPKRTKHDDMSDAEQTRRILAISAYNNASDFLDRSELSEEDAYRALCEALASRALWEPIGNAMNLLIGDWQVTRALTVNGMADDAVTLIESAISRAIENAVDDWLIASLHEGYSRALLHADDERYGDVYMVTVQLIAGISDLEDRSIIEAQFADLPMP